MSAQTRAFLFCDLRGYSAFTDAHGDRAARELLAAYRAAVREVITTFQGSEIRTEGDSFYVVFASVSDAVEAGLAILAHLEALSRQQPDRPIRAGIGVHAGETEDSEEGIVSTAVNIAARICAIAEPDEFLVSDTVRALTRGYLEVGFTPRGERRLKGIAEPVRVYRVTTTAPSAAASARRAPPARRLAVAGGAAAVVIGAVIAGAAILNGGLAAAQPTPEPSVTPAASSHASATASGPIGSGLAFPNADEAALLARLPESLTAGCVRADADEIPDYQYGINPMTALPYHAALRCPFAGGIDAFFFAAVGPSAAATTLFGYAGRRGAESGSCADDGPATEHWSSGRAEGWVLCGADAFWTYDGTNVLGRANGGRDAGVVMDWWRENARFPVE